MITSSYCNTSLPYSLFNSFRSSILKGCKQTGYFFFLFCSFGSVESNFACFAVFCPLSHFQEESPLSVSSPECIGTWLHYTSGVGTGRRRRRSGEQITSSPVSPKSLAFTSSIFGSWQQVFKLYFIKHYYAFQATTNCL